MGSATFNLIRNTIGRALPAAGLARSGTLRRETPSTVLDANNDPMPPIITSIPFEGFRDEFSSQERNTSQIPEDEFKIVIYGTSISVEPIRDDQILLQNQWSRVLSIFEIDPANAAYILRCTTIRAPI